MCPGVLGICPLHTHAILPAPAPGQTSLIDRCAPSCWAQVQSEFLSAQCIWHRPQVLAATPTPRGTHVQSHVGPAWKGGDLGGTRPLGPQNLHLFSSENHPEPICEEAEPPGAVCVSALPWLFAACRGFWVLEPPPAGLTRAFLCKCAP